MSDNQRLVTLYHKGRLSEVELLEYSDLRKQEYQARKTELIEQGKQNIRAVKGSDGDIIAFSWDCEEAIQETV